MSRLASASRAVHRALQALAGFVGAIKIGSGDLNVSLDLVPERGLADSGDLDAEGMIYSPAHGDTAFTVPLFHAYLKRITPFPTDE